jgi:hypothetical protein
MISVRLPDVTVAGGMVYLNGEIDADITGDRRNCRELRLIPLFRHRRCDTAHPVQAVVTLSKRRILRIVPFRSVGPGTIFFRTVAAYWRNKYKDYIYSNSGGSL